MKRRFAVALLTLAVWTCLWPLSLLASPAFRAGAFFDVPLQDGKTAKAFVFVLGDQALLHLLTESGVVTYQLTPLESPVPPQPTLSEMARWTRDEAGKVAAPHRSLASALADTFSAISLRIRNGEIATPEEAIAQTAKENAKILDTQEKIDAWAGFREALRQRLNTMSQEGKLSTMEEHARVWDEISQGLKLVK